MFSKDIYSYFRACPFINFEYKFVLIIHRFLNIFSQSVVFIFILMFYTEQIKKKILNSNLTFFFFLWSFCTITFSSLCGTPASFVLLHLILPQSSSEYHFVLSSFTLRRNRIVSVTSSSNSPLFFLL